MWHPRFPPEPAGPPAALGDGETPDATRSCATLKGWTGGGRREAGGGRREAGGGRREAGKNRATRWGCPLATPRRPCSCCPTYRCPSGSLLPPHPGGGCVGGCPSQPLGPGIHVARLVRKRRFWGFQDLDSNLCAPLGRWSLLNTSWNPSISLQTRAPPQPGTRRSSATTAVSSEEASRRLGRKAQDSTGFKAGRRSRPSYMLVQK